MEMYAQEIFFGTVAIIIVLLLLVLRLEIRIRKLLRGNSAKNIEDCIEQIENDVKDIKNFRAQVTTYLESLEKRVGKSVQGVGTIRFNPFKGTGSGGNQSFATTFLNEKGDGVILSSLYSREHVSIFAKPIKNYQSEFEITEEEAESLKKAKDAIKADKR